METSTLTQTNETQVSILLLDFALDGASTHINVTTSFSPDLTQLTLTFDHFTGTLDYDPNLGVLVDSGSNGQGDGLGSGGSGSLDVILPAVLVPVVVVGFCAVFVLIALFALFSSAKYKRSRRLSSGVISFDAYEKDKSDNSIEGVESL